MLVEHWYLFRGYLLSRSAGSEVGLTWYAWGSPVAYWLEYETGHPHVIFVNGYGKADDEDDWHGLPLWVTLYHPLIDGRKDRYGTPILREQAISALEVVERLWLRQLLPEKAEHHEI